MKPTQFYINGVWTDPLTGTPLDVINPSTEEICTTISLGGDADTQAAVHAAKEAFHSWSLSSKADRLALMRRILSVYKKRHAEIAAAISQEMGAPIDMAVSSQAGSGNYHIQAFIDALEQFQFERELRPDTPNDRILYEPIGVCALITPWNWPMNQIALKVMPAIAAGCTMILKPSELSPLSAMVFADILHEAGVPAGVFNLVNGDGAGVGSALSRHPDIALISFTGSSRAGIAISKNAAESLKRVSLELGGKGANIIFADADKDAVTKGVAHCFNNTGQSCNAPTRMLVERSRYEQAVDEARIQAENTRVNLASKEGQHIGPLVSKTQFDKVQALIKHGIDTDGVRLISGGPGRPEGLQRGCQRYRLWPDQLCANSRRCKSQSCCPTFTIRHGGHEWHGTLLWCTVWRLQAFGQWTRRWCVGAGRVPGSEGCGWLGQSVVLIRSYVPAGTVK